MLLEPEVKAGEARDQITAAHLNEIITEQLFDLSCVVCQFQVSFGTGEVTGVFMEVLQDLREISFRLFDVYQQDDLCFGQRGPGMDKSSTNVPVAGAWLKILCVLS